MLFVKYSTKFIKKGQLHSLEVGRIIEFVIKFLK